SLEHENRVAGNFETRQPDRPPCSFAFPTDRCRYGKGLAGIAESAIQQLNEAQRDKAGKGLAMWHWSVSHKRHERTKTHCGAEESLAPLRAFACRMTRWKQIFGLGIGAVLLSLLVLPKLASEGPNVPMSLRLVRYETNSVTAQTEAVLEAKNN